MKPTRAPWPTLTRKELTVFFNAPATYVIFVVFLVMTGWLFVSPLFLRDQSTLDTFLQPLPLILTFVIPALTMRAFSEEFRAGTMEYLGTLPIQDYEIVLAKYLAAMGLFGALLAFTLVYPLILMVVGQPDYGQMFGSYCAVIGLASFYAAIGLWASSMTRNQVVAFIIGFFTCFFFFLLGQIAELLPGFMTVLLRPFGVGPHFDSLARGVLDSRDLLYWASGTAFFLLASLASLNSRRWR